MAYEKKVDRLVTMVAPSMKTDLENEADSENIPVADIVRRAIRDRKRFTNVE